MQSLFLYKKYTYKRYCAKIKIRDSKNEEFVHESVRKRSTLIRIGDVWWMDFDAIVLKKSSMIKKRQ